MIVLSLNAHCSRYTRALVVCRRSQIQTCCIEDGIGEPRKTFGHRYALLASRRHDFCCQSLDTRTLNAEVENATFSGIEFIFGPSGTPESKYLHPDAVSSEQMHSPQGGPALAKYTSTYRADHVVFLMDESWRPDQISAPHFCLELDDSIQVGHRQTDMRKAARMKTHQDERLNGGPIDEVKRQIS